MSTMMKVLNTNNKKLGQAEKISDELYTVIFEDGSQKEVKAATFVRWYQVLTDADLETTEAAPANNESAPNTENEEATKADEEAAEKAKADKEAENIAKKLAKEEEIAAKKAAKAIADAEKKKAKEADAAAKKEAAEKAKAEKEAEAARKKAEKEANSAAPKAAVRIQEFFGSMMDKLKKAQFELVGNQQNRVKNFRVFRFGIGNFRYVVRLAGSVVTCELYIKASEKVSTDLLTALHAYKDEIEKALGYELVWEFNPELMHSKAFTKLDIGTDADAIDWCVVKLSEFNTVFTPYVEKIAAQ